MEEDEVGFSSSKLGTKDYWDTCYVTENDNFDDHGDVGEVWFGKCLLSGVASKLKSFLNSLTL